MDLTRPAATASIPSAARRCGTLPSTSTASVAPSPWQKPVMPTNRPRDSSLGVSASTVASMQPTAATPTEKNSAQASSCGKVRASG